MMIHDQLESVLIGGRRVDPEEQWEIRRNGWDEHVRIIDALRSRKPKACRAAMVSHIRTTSEYKARLMPVSDPGRQWERQGRATWPGAHGTRDASRSRSHSRSGVGPRAKPSLRS